MEREMIKFQDRTWTKTNELQYRAVAVLIWAAVLYGVVAASGLAVSGPLQLASAAAGLVK
jgi:hypothetical protein